jgi:PiT family inorganic phosphate transporter
LLFDYTNGFHDSANSISKVVATGGAAARLAVLWAAFFNFIAFAFFGTKVANTVGQTVKPGFASVAVIFAAMTGAILWNYTTWWLRLPTSSSHALIGGLVGAGLAKGGLEAIKASSVQKAVVFLVVSPIAGLLMALLNLWLRGRHESGNERAFKAGQLVSSAAVSLEHGTNDAQKTMGVIAALLVATGHLQASGDKLPIPLWVVLAAHAAIALGTISGGWRIVQTLGQRITELRPARGMAAETGAAIALFGSTAVGAPVSTTHTMAGAVTGVGVVTRGVPVNWTVFGQMALA